MRPLNEIIVHCTATPPQWMEGQPTSAKAAEVRKWHVQDRGWKDTGYHYLIDRDGTTVEARPLDQIGAHTKGHNTGTIGIALIGGFGSSADDSFDDHFTLAQNMALRNLIAQLKYQYSITKVSGHNEYANKACPGFRVPKFMGEPAPKERTSATQSTTVQASAVQVASAAGAGITAISALDGTAQLVVMVLAGVIALAAVWIMRERLKKWANGIR